MLTKETCVQIWSAHNEIEKSQKLLSDLAERVRADIDRKPVLLGDAFGEQRGLMLGVPSGDNGHQLYNVDFELSVKVIEAHIENKKKRLSELHAIAKIEISQP